MPDPSPALSFTAFVLSLASTAAIHFGDLPDPISGQRSELNLDGAAQMIEILSLLDQKTRGNLTAEERQMLEQVLYELRMRFVEATGRTRRISRSTRRSRSSRASVPSARTSRTSATIWRMPRPKRACLPAWNWLMMAWCWRFPDVRSTPRTPRIQRKIWSFPLCPSCPLC
jgi:hypothetical protein